MDGFDFKKLGDEVDDLLSDVRGLLQEDADAEDNAAQDIDCALQDGAQMEQAPSAQPAGAREEDSVKSADDIHIDYRKFYGEELQDAAQQENEAVVFQPLTAYEQSKPAYQTAKRAEYERAREQERLQRERERLEREQEEERIMRRMETEQKQRGRRKKRDRRPPMDEKAYSEWLYEQGDGELTRAQREAAARFAEEGGGERPRRREKRHIGAIWKILIFLLVLLGAGAIYIHFFWAEQPLTLEDGAARKEDYATILIAGTDRGGYRTDTMMLLSLDKANRTISLVSIPRDTLVYCEYSVPKLNSAYGFAGGGEDGMKELLRRVGEITGFTPDGYVLVDLDVFEKLVDLMGGVKFDVPMDMHYSDPSQGLEIDLKAGEQKLSGDEAVQLVRFRSGYTTADLGRVDVQRQFVSAAMDQWVSIKNIIKIPSALKLLTDASQTNLTSGNLVWLAEAMLSCDRQNIRTRTLPGTPMDIAGGSYYVLDAVGVAETINECCNPYEQGVAVSDLYIRVG